MAIISIRSIRDVYRATEKQVAEEITGKIFWIKAAEEKEGYKGNPKQCQTVGIESLDSKGPNDQTAKVFVNFENREVLSTKWKGVVVRLSRGDGGTGTGLKVWVSAKSRGVDFTRVGEMEVVQHPGQHQSAPPASQGPPPSQQAADPPPAQPTDPPGYEPEGYEPDEEGPYSASSEAPPKQETLPDEKGEAYKRQGIALRSTKGMVAQLAVLFHECRMAAHYEAKVTYAKTGVASGWHGTATTLFIQAARELGHDLVNLPKSINLDEVSKAHVDAVMRMTEQEYQDEMAKQQARYDKAANRTPSNTQ